MKEILAGQPLRPDGVLTVPVNELISANFEVTSLQSSDPFVLVGF